MNDDLRAAARGIGSNYLASAAILGAQVLYTAVTARLISPEGFGAFAVAQALAGLVSYFGLATLGSALIRHERYERIVVGTAAVLSVLAGCVAAGVMLVAAAPWADLWGIPASEGTARLFAAVAFAAALSVIPLAVLRKRLRYGRAAAIEASGAIAGMAAGVALAVELRSPTALVLGQAAGAAAMALSAAFSAREELTLGFSREHARSLLAFAGHVSGQSVLYYGIYAAPGLVISRLFGAATLGVYSRANALVTLPTTHLWIGVTKALYPLVARARDDRRRLQQLIERTLLSTTALLWPLFAAVAGSAPLVVDVLLGSEFSAAVAMLPPLLVFGAVNLAYVVAGNPLEVLGLQRIIWTYQLVWVALLGAALGASVLTDASPATLLWGVALAQVAIHAVKLRVAAKVGLLRVGPILAGYAVTLAVAALFYGLAEATESLLSDSSLILRALGQAAVVGGVTALFLRVPRTPMHRALVDLLQSLRPVTVAPTPPGALPQAQSREVEVIRP